MSGQRLCLLAFLLGISVSALAQHQPIFRLPPGDRLFLAGLEAYEGGRYDTAMTYLQDASLWANKPAQFNIGAMYHNGQGVEKDLVEAYAWFALSAERFDDARMNELRDQTLAQLTTEDQERAKVREQELLSEHGDDRRLAKVAKWFRNEKREVTGSRVGFSGSALTIYSMSASGHWTWYSGTEYMKYKAEWLSQWEQQYIPEGYTEFGELQLLEDEVLPGDAGDELPGGEDEQP
ncbi:MAG: sel1 repeat family protein [Gammaproteobacteria bacterium]|nr:MAG: sel1 repeat family protein [Gammaproteobacteria bacterium]